MMPARKICKEQKMKIFQTVQTHYATLGISFLNRSASSSKRVNFGFLSFGCIFVSQSWYTFHVASSFMEYVEGICASSGTTINFACFAAIVFRKATLFETIDNFERLINTRNFRIGYIHKFYRNSMPRFEQINAHFRT